MITNVDRPAIQEQIFVGLGDSEEVQRAQRALLDHRFILRGLSIWNEEDYPVDGVVLEVRAFPIDTIVAGPMADGSFGAREWNRYTQRWQLAKIYPAAKGRMRPNRYIIATKSDGLNEHFVEIQTPRFQPAANLVNGPAAAIVATVLLGLVALLWRFGHGGSAVSSRRQAPR